MSRLGRAALLCLMLAAGGCAQVVDSDQARLCRIVLQALNPDDAAILILRQTPLAEGAGARIDYRVERPGLATRARFAECRFGGGAQASGRLDLRSVTTESGPLNDVRMLFLKRFWLETPDSVTADPSPVPGSDSAREMSFTAAYALQQGVNGLPLAAIYGLLAAAYSLVYGLVGRINLAFGELAAAGGYAALFGVVLAGGASPALPLAFAALLAVSTALFHGVVSARLVFVPLQRATGQQALVATVGLSLFLQEYLRLTQGTGLRWVSPILAEPVPLARAGAFVVTVTPIALMLSGIAALAACAVLAVLKFTRFGRDWRAYADDPRAAMLFGVDPTAIFARTFALGAALAGLAGFIMTIYYGGVGYGASTALGLKALIAAILGGIGSAPGALAGGVVIGLVEALWSAYFPVVYRDVAIYCLLAALLVWRPGGLLGYGDLTPRRV